MNKNKKGFTIVELVIVIAIIAILAAILIPTFANIIRTAHISADTQLIRNLNTALTVDSAKNGKHTTMQSALDAAESAGYLVGRINASATQNEILWDSKNDMFCYLDTKGTDDTNDDEIVYMPKANKAYEDVADVDYFVIASELSAKYSTYLYNYDGETDLTIDKGLDVGKVTTITSVTYETDATQTAIIRSNGGTLTINAPNSTVYHYGFASVVNVNDVDNSSCYHEGGKVGRLIYDDNDGKIFFESTATTYCYMNTSTDANANVSSETKADGAVVYTYVDSGVNEAKGYAAVDKVEVTVENGIVAVSTCLNHNEDYDIIHVGDNVYLVCKCCGGFSKISTDENGTTTVESSDGITESNNFVAENNSELPIVNAVATIGYSKYYETLAAAVADAKDGDTIVMLSDDMLTGSVSITKKLTLDLNGKQVGRIVNTLTSAILLNNGELIINDSVGTGSVLANAQAIGMTNSNDKLIINGGKIQGATYGVRIQIGDSVVINGGRIIGGSYGIYNQAAQSLSVSNANILGSTYGIRSKATSSITVSNSTISATSTVSTSYAIESAGDNSNVIIENSNISGVNGAIKSSKANSSVTVKSGTISGRTYGIVNSGTLTIEDGTIQANLYYGVSNSGTLNMNGGTIIGGTHESYGRGIYNNGTAIINGGVVKMNVQTPKLQVAIDNRKNLTINDCTITSDTIGVYSTDSFTFAGGIITAAIEGIQNYGTASLSGGEILVENVTNKVNTMGILNYNTVTISGDIVIVNNNAYTSEPKLDDNGEVELDEKGEPKLIEYIPYGILSNGTADNKANLTINGGSISAPDGFALDLYNTDATITDGTLSGANAIVSWTEDSTCTISSGNFNATGSQVCYANKGFFTISGGTFTGGKTTQYEDNQYRFALNCYDSNYTDGKAGFTVTGGSFYQFNPQNDLSEGANTCFTPEGYHTEYNESTGYYTVVENN